MKRYDSLLAVSHVMLLWKLESLHRYAQRDAILRYFSQKYLLQKSIWIDDVTCESMEHARRSASKTEKGVSVTSLLREILRNSTVPLCIFMPFNRCNCLPLALSLFLCIAIHRVRPHRGAFRRNDDPSVETKWKFTAFKSLVRIDTMSEWFSFGPSLSVPSPINYNPLTPEPWMERFLTASKFTSTSNACFRLRRRLIQCTFAPKDFPYINMRWKKRIFQCDRKFIIAFPARLKLLPLIYFSFSNLYSFNTLK